MKLIVNAFFAPCLTIFLTICMVQIARADGPAYLTIRFNQKNVSYQEKLTYAVNEAVKTKPTVVFDVVDVSPSGEIGRVHGQEVVDNITRNGIPANQITLKSETGDVTSEEVRIFVR